MVPTAKPSPTTRQALLRRSFADDERPRRELEQLYALIALLLDQPPPPDPIGLFPRYESLRQRLGDSLSSGDPERIEEAFLEAYCHLHGHEAPYTPAERAIVD
ncbi:MAG: hypothetical protein JRI68_23855 [Deltaproteobacteria bacterium]|nr:hypothetical protein [Deltaproteobacteria bacterium]